MTTQPIWTLAWSTDERALYLDDAGHYDPEVAVLVQVVDDSEIESSRTAPYHVCRFPIPRLALVTRDPIGGDQEDYAHPVLVEADLLARYLAHGRGAGRDQFPHALRSYDAWYTKNLPDTARSAGCAVESLIADLCSEDPTTRAHAYIDVAGYWGLDNFDSDPREWSASEAAEWPERGKLKIKLSPSDEDDGSITVYSDDVYGAITDRSIEGSSWEAPRDMSVAYASILDRADLLSDLEREYDVDSSEYSPPSDEDLERWSIKADLSDADYSVEQHYADPDDVWTVECGAAQVAIGDTEIEAWRAARDHHRAGLTTPDIAHHTDEDE